MATAAPSLRIKNETPQSATLNRWQLWALTVQKVQRMKTSMQGFDSLPEPEPRRERNPTSIRIATQDAPSSRLRLSLPERAAITT